MFDSLNCNFFLKTLEYVNFGRTFIGLFKTMYNDIQSTILNNGTICTYFKVQREVRQGCQLSAYLFIIALETLACKVRNDNTIKGIKIDNKEIKISLWADDITMSLADLIYVKNSLTVLICFTKK